MKVLLRVNSGPRCSYWKFWIRGQNYRQPWGTIDSFCRWHWQITWSFVVLCNKKLGHVAKADEWRTACILLVSSLFPARFTCPLFIMRKIGWLGFLGVLIYNPRREYNCCIELFQPLGSFSPPHLRVKPSLIAFFSSAPYSSIAILATLEKLWDYFGSWVFHFELIFNTSLNISYSLCLA